MKPLTALTTADYCSPLDDARAEITRLKLAVAALEKDNGFRRDSRLLDLQLRNRNYRQFIKERGLLTEFQQRYPY